MNTESNEGWSVTYESGNWRSENANKPPNGGLLEVVGWKSGDVGARLFLFVSITATFILNNPFQDQAGLLP